MPTKCNTSRETKAVELITTGAVQLFVGQGTAEVTGGKGETYKVTHESCTCPDFTRRGAGCKHRLAVKQLCDEYRQLQAAAERGETIRPSRHLLRALRWPERPQAAGCKECGAPTDFDICFGCFFGQRGAA